MTTMTIGEVVRRTGKPASTIRYYEEIGLLPPPERLSLDEIRLLLEASPTDSLATERLREVAQRRLPKLAESIARAELARAWLEAAADCRCPSLDDCPLFEEPVASEGRSAQDVDGPR